ncbi:MAG TPA: PIN domain-containing protein [Clostridiales bacterium]|nr:PIN domain-containing protein [Clostridiales bacterium]
MLKIYFDACCYNRPFDDLTQERIRLETEAILLVMNKISNNGYKLYGSPAIEFELSRMNNDYKKKMVIMLYSSMKKELLKYDEKINIRSKALDAFNIKYFDALHIAFCEFYNIDYMLTTDKVLINAVKRSDIAIRVVNPIEFVMEVLE